MAYQRKTKDRLKFKTGWLGRRRAALIAAGMRPRELDIVRLHDGRGMTFVAIAAQLGISAPLVQRTYVLAAAKLLSPRRRPFRPASPFRTK